MVNQTDYSSTGWNPGVATVWTLVWRQWLWRRRFGQWLGSRYWRRLLFAPTVVRVKPWGFKTLLPYRHDGFAGASHRRAGIPRDSRPKVLYDSYPQMGARSAHPRPMQAPVAIAAIKNIFPDYAFCTVDCSSVSIRH